MLKKQANLIQFLLSLIQLVGNHIPPSSQIEIALIRGQLQGRPNRIFTERTQQNSKKVSKNSTETQEIIRQLTEIKQKVKTWMLTVVNQTSPKIWEKF